MFLKTLEAQGFKSFPDKTVLTFEKGITAVVGPNGSGKSNIADAISWVLGEQSTKQLRGEKMEDVIFNGTVTRSAQGMAYVTICFDNTDRSLLCDSDEVYITRRYYRSGESRYEINHNTVRLKDINELFMDTGVGRDGYSMIGQGKISEIVGKRSDERRDMFEEAAGISRYRYRKIEAERKLSAAEDNLVRLRDILGELNDRIGPLERESKKAQSFIEYSGEKKQLEIGLWLLKLNKINEQSKRHEEKLFAVNSQYSQLEQELDSVNDVIEAKTGLSQEITVRIDDMRRTVSAFEEQAAVTEGQIAVARNNILHLDENIDRLQSQINDALFGGNNIDNDIDSKKKEIASVDEQINSLKNVLTEESERFEKFVAESEEFSRISEELNRQIAALQNEISLCEVKRVTAVSTVKQIESRRSSVDDILAQRRERKVALDNELAQLKEDLDRLEDEINSRKNTIGGIDLIINSRKSKTDELKKEIDETVIESQTKKRRALMLREMEKNMDEFNHAVKVVMRESERGSLGGIKGPVSRLIKVASEYTIAIETALGNAMQDIVVNTEGDAKRAIELLKKNKDGRATFLPLTSVKRRNFTEKNLDDCYGFVGVASELVECDEKYNDVVSSMLGAIVVAEDLDSAVSIAKKYSYRFKIVTLDGQVVNSGGSMTGGSLIKNAGVLGRTAEIERIEKEAETLDRKASELSDKFNEASAVLAEKNAELEAVKAEITTLGEDKIRVLSEIRRVSEQSEETVLQISELVSEKQSADEKIAQLNTDISDAISQSEEISKNVLSLEQQLTRNSGDQDELTAKREALSESNSELRLKIVAFEKDKDALESQLNSLTALKEDASGQIDRLNDEIADINSRKKSELNHIVDLERSVSSLREQAVECTGNIEKLSAKRIEAESVSTSERAREKELTLRREQLSQEIARLGERGESFGKEIDDILSKLYDEYELTRTDAQSMGIVIEDQADASKRLSEIKNKIRSLGSVNVGAIEEYKEVKIRYDFLNTQVEDVENSKKQLLGLIDDLTGTMQELFTTRFTAINSHFTHTFVDLFGGGTAELKLSDPIDVLNSGIDINVQPPGKKVSSIEQLSGGEKSLVAIAIYFAMMKVSPPPFCMLDEVESALDDVNVDRFAAYLRRMCDNTQFVIVTHRRGSMEEADVLYGVTMQEKGVSKLLQLKINEVENLIK